MSLNSCCTLNVLIHYHITQQVHPQANMPAVQEATHRLESQGLIERVDRHYETTPKGEFFLEHLLSVPFPVEVYAIPGQGKS